MVSVFDVADFFLLCTKHPKKITNMKLNKLVYYAQAWALVRLHRPLFPEGIEAWQHGPIVPQIYHKYASYGSSAIKRPESSDVLNKFEEEEAQLLFDVLREYDDLSAWQLSGMSHAIGEPWRLVYSETIKPIPRSLIEECFSEKDALPVVDMSTVFDDVPVVCAMPSDGEDE